MMLRKFKVYILHTKLKTCAKITARMSSTDKIYEKAHDHWTGVASNVDGMLGGFAQLHTEDIKASKEFIKGLRKANVLVGRERALDCGSGIGRVTKHLLLPIFKTVDMVDFASQFIEDSRKYIGEDSFKQVGNQFVDSLHTFEPQQQLYDLIWVQWVSGHLSDEHFVQFFKRCRLAVKQGGCIVLKDNIAPGQKKDFDEEDNSWTRPNCELLELFEQSGCEVVSNKKQFNFPKGMYQVRMFALKAKEDEQLEN